MTKGLRKADGRWEDTRQGERGGGAAVGYTGGLMHYGHPRGAEMTDTCMGAMTCG